MMIVLDCWLWAIPPPSSNVGTADPAHSQMRNEWIFGTRHEISFLICHDTSSARCLPSLLTLLRTKGVDFGGPPPSWHLHQHFIFSCWPFQSGMFVLNCLLPSRLHTFNDQIMAFRDGKKNLTHCDMWLGIAFALLLLFIIDYYFLHIGDWAWGLVHGG